MQITRYTDYSLRVLIYLAVNSTSLTTINEIASRYGISKNHLMKIVQMLNQEGYLLAIRGKNGGVKLNRPTNEINIGKLVRLIEDKKDLLECHSVNNQCVITPSCQLKNIFNQALESFYDTLDSYTLQDIVNDKNTNELTQLLTIK